jgi:signal transduction histidine kinase
VKSPSLRVRLALWAVVVVGGALVVFAFVMVATQQRVGLRHIDQELEEAGLQLANMLGEELREVDSPKLAAEETRNVLASTNRPMAIVSGNGEVLATNFDVPALSGFLALGIPMPGAHTIASDTGGWRVHAHYETIAGAVVWVVVAAPLLTLVQDEREIGEALLVGMPIALVLAAAGGLWLASISLQPIAVMVRRAGRLPLTGVEDLGPPARDDELGRLTRAFNAVVARLRSALQTQRQFMADASHELRNPVSVIRNASDIALTRAHREESEYRDALRMIHEQSQRLATLVEDMLVLARVDAGGYPVRPVECYVDDVIDDCQRAMGLLAASRFVQVTASGASDVAIRGDQELLRRLLVNLLQNAVQHSPPGATVSIDVSLKGRDVCIRVIDSGTGIPRGDLTRIFDRFVQLDPARRAEGAGLGLTIARWIAEAHNGSLEVESSGPHGTTFRLALPGASLAG